MPCSSCLPGPRVTPACRVMFGYAGKTNELKVEEKGSGGLEEFTENLNDGRIEFGYLRFAVNQTFKFLFVSWCGGGVDGMRKGFFNNHTKEFENWLGQGGRGFHLQINARSEDDLDPAIVLDKLNKVSSFIKATSLKSAAQDKEQLKQQSSQYWQKEKQIDAQRKEALTAHQQAQQQNLAAAKDAEQRRLAAQAKDTISSMEAQRQANVQEYQVFAPILLFTLSLSLLPSPSPPFLPSFALLPFPFPFQFSSFSSPSFPLFSFSPSLSPFSPSLSPNTLPTPLLLGKRARASTSPNQVARGEEGTDLGRPATHQASGLCTCRLQSWGQTCATCAWASRGVQRCPRSCVCACACA